MGLAVFGREGERRRRVVAAGAACLLAATTASADPLPSAPPMPTPVDALGEDLARAFTGTSLLLFGGAVAVTGGMAFGGADQAIRVGVQEHGRAPAYGDIALYAGYIAPLVVAPALYVVGLAAPDRAVAGAGAAAIQALALAFVTTSALKLAVGRVYPLNGDDPRSPSRLDHPAYATEFHPFQRLDLPSLPAWPSGHTSAGIAVAAALTAYAPDNVWIPIAGYPLALAIGFGMVEGDRHWASDVVAGALLGHALGYSVGRSFRLRVRDGVGPTSPAATPLTRFTVVPLAGPIYGLGAAATW